MVGHSTSSTSAPDELIWQAGHPSWCRLPASPAYYISLGAAVVIVVGLLAFAAIVTVKRPQQAVAGSRFRGGSFDHHHFEPGATADHHVDSGRAGTVAELAAHPLSSATVRMPNATCALPRFDPADDHRVSSTPPQRFAPMPPGVRYFRRLGLRALSRSSRSPPP